MTARTQETTRRNIIGVGSINSRLLYDRLVKVAVGETITYHELGAVIDADVQRGAYGALDTARNRASRDDGIEFGTLTNVGLRRLADAEIVGTLERTFGHIRRVTRKQQRVLANVADFASLPADVQTRHNTGLSMMGALRAATAPKTIKVLEARVAMAAAPLALAKTLDAFKGSS
jgi:hypothetical protein